MIKRAISAAAVLLLVAATGSLASEAVPDAHKRESFRRFIVLMGAEAQYHQAIEIFLSNFKDGFERGLKKGLENLEENDAETYAKATAIAGEAINQYVSSLKEAMATIAPFPELVEEVYYPVFAAQFTAQEFDDLSRFYESPLGRKLASQGPQLMQQSAAKFNDKYGAKLEEQAIGLAKEQFGAIREKLEDLKQNEEAGH